ncbi:MAG: hypothetical protein SPJ04_08740 [Bdellovibrionota bacterium]|nr:hypothetical protein [Bdellovibrionota bacterium]
MNSKTQNFLRTDRQQAAGSRQQAAGKHYSKNLTPRFSVNEKSNFSHPSQDSLQKLIKKYCPNGCEYKSLWEVTSWDKKFNGVSNNKQKIVLKFSIFQLGNLNQLKLIMEI